MVLLTANHCNLNYCDWSTPFESMDTLPACGIWLKEMHIMRKNWSTLLVLVVVLYFFKHYPAPIDTLIHILAFCPIPIHVKRLFFCHLEVVSPTGVAKPTLHQSLIRLVCFRREILIEEGSIFCHNIKQYKVSYILENQKQKHNKTKILT